MTDPISKFFERLSQGTPKGLSEKTRATMRFDLEQGGELDHWFITIEMGKVRVSREAHEADCVLHADKTFFASIVSGTANMDSGLFRNEIAVEGDMRTYATWRKMLPGPPGARDPKAARGRDGGDDRA